MFCLELMILGAPDVFMSLSTFGQEFFQPLTDKYVSKILSPKCHNRGYQRI